MSFNITQPQGLYRSRFTRSYVMDRGSVDILADQMTKDNGVLTELFTTLSDGAQFIYSLRMYPYDILEKCKTYAGASDYEGIVDGKGNTGDPLDPDNAEAIMLKCINLGKYIAYNTPLVSEKPSIREKIDGVMKTMCGAIIDNNYNANLYIGNVLIDRKYNNYLDYAPYTKLELYLPFYGIVDLDVNLSMDRRIDINYVIDFGSGCATAFITNNKGVLIKDVTFKIAIDIPIEQTNAADMRRDNTMLLLSSAVGIGGAVATGGASALAGGLLASTGLNAINSLNKNRERLLKGAEMSGISGWYGNTTPFVIITRSIPNEPTNYNILNGRPSGMECVLSDEINNGSYFEVENVHLEGFTTASSKELEEIERLLKTGVIG